MTPAQIAQVQTRLNALLYDAGPADGVFGGRTRTAIKQFQENNGLTPDGIYGQKTAAALMSPNAKPYVTAGSRPPVAMVPSPAKPGVPLWPAQSGVQGVFGPPGNPKCTAGRAKLPFAFRIAWDLDQKVTQFSCHELVAEALTQIFSETAAAYGEQKFRALGLDLFGGCYNLRQMRGGNSYSMHAWGIAVDLDPERNQLKWGRDRAEFAKPEYDAFWDVVESHGAVSLGRKANYDWMHFQFARI